MKTPHTLAVFLCMFICAHAETAVISPPRPESFRHQAIMRQLDRYFKDSLDSPQEKRKFLKLNLVENGNGDSWHSDPLAEGRFATTKDITAQFPHSYKISGNMTLYFRSKLIVYAMNDDESFALMSLPYHAGGLAFIKKF